MPKLVKAVVRLELLEELIVALKDAGVPRLTVSHVRSIGSGVDPKRHELSLELGTQYTEKALIQFVCGDDQVGSLVDIVTRHGHTGRRGDGVVFVTPVDHIVKIRTGVAGLQALQ